MRWLVWPAIAAVVALMALSASPAQDTHAQVNNAMDAVGPAAAVSLTSQFNVDVNITAAPNAWAGWQGYLSWDDSLINYVASPGVAYTGLGGTSLDATPSEVDADIDTVTDGVQFGTAKASGTSTLTGTVATVSLQCVGEGTDIALHLVTVAEDAAFGTATLALGGGKQITDTVDGDVTCAAMADLYIIGTHAPASPLAGGEVVKTVTVINKGPQAAASVMVTETYDDGKVYLGNDNPGGCQDLEPLGFDNTIVCFMGSMDPGAMAQFHITFGVELGDAGKTNVNGLMVQSITFPGMVPVTMDPNQHPQPLLDEIGFYNCLGERLSSVNPIDPPEPLLCNNVWADQFTVAPADVSVVKVGPAQKLSGDLGQYTITVTSNGPSPASNVVVVDTVPAGVTVTGVTPTPDCGFVGNVVTCNWAVLAVSEVKVVTIDVTFATAGTFVNSCTVEWADPLTDVCNEVTTLVLPPFNGMVKDCRPDIAGIQDACNLWLCKEFDPTTGLPNPDCHVTDPETGAQIGKGILDVADFLFLRADVDSPNDADILPEGLAAYEEQLKYDHKIFDVTINDAGSDGLDNDGDTLIDEIDESVIAGWRGNINCTMTIMTENWIMFGCVSAGQELGNPMPVGEWLKTIHLVPDSDMFQRIRPTKDNGVVSTILDENCEVADIYASEPWPFTLPGGLTEDCADLTVTVRMLEGDLNLDCEVNVLDQQAIAFRYSATFGLLLYDKFYDLEPKLTDFDIDIKDLQFVWGRDGSMCQAPIPDGQTPSPAIPDP